MTRAPGSPVAVIGDCALDITVAPLSPWPGRPAGDAPAQIGVGPGGQGANVAVRLARAGVPVRLVTPLAEDAAGQLLRSLLAADRLELVALPAVRSSVVVARLDAAGERSMESDRASIGPSSAASLGAAVAGCHWIHVSGYALRDPGEAAVVAAALKACRTDAGVRLSVGGGSVSPGTGAARSLGAAITDLDPDLLIVDLEEAGALLGRADEVATAAAALADSRRVAVVTAGARGSAAARHAGGPPLVVPAPVLPGDVRDTTGAGDAFTAALVAALRDRPWPPGGPSLEGALAAASRLGGLVARTFGAQGRVAGEPDPLP